MQKSALASVGLFLTACGGLAATSNNAADASQGSARIEQTTKPKGGAGGSVTREWLVGTWAKVGENCDSSAQALRISGDGRFNSPQYGGDWRLARGQLVFSYRDTSQWGDEMVSAQMEAASPLRTRTAAITRLNGERFSLAGEIWRRCSPDPDFYLQ